MNDVFRRLRNAVPGLPADLTPHVLRHDWDERFSEAIDALPLERRPKEEKKSTTRCRTMAWSPGSSMAGNYTRRYVRDDFLSNPTTIQVWFGRAVSAD